MKKLIAAFATLALVTAVPAAAQSSNMSFFITSVGSGDGANLGGLQGADQHCQDLAYAKGFGVRHFTCDGRDFWVADDDVGKGGRGLDRG